MLLFTIFLLFVVSPLLIYSHILLLNKNKTEKYSRGLYMSSYEYKNIYKVVTPLKKLISPIKDLKQDKPLPNIFIYNPKYFSPVRDQGQCGACWAFVICSMISDNVTIRLLHFGENLNVQQLISCYPSENSCDGESPEDALLWMQKKDFKLNVESKYKEEATNCEEIKKGISIKNNSIQSLCEYIERESITNPTPQEKSLLEKNIKRMKLQLIQDGPFFGSLSIYEDFFNYKGDKVYIKSSDKLNGGHAITIVGWCDKGVDKRKGFEDGYWVCKNSWGTNWAPEFIFPGYFAIKMGNNECGIESRSGIADANVAFKLKDKKIPSYFVFNTYQQYLKHILQETKNKIKN